MTITRGDCKSRLLRLLKRSDCSDDDATTFLAQGMSRIQRMLRIPSMERLFTLTPSTPLQSFQVPSDLLQVIDVYGAAKPLERKAFRQLMLMASQEFAGQWPDGAPTYYARVGANIVLYPSLQAGAQLMLTYYGVFSDLPDDASSNEATTNLADVLVYAGLSFAGDFYRMDKGTDWEARFQGLLTEAQDQSNQLDATGGGAAVTSAYGDF